MPAYEYECQSCACHFEQRQKMSDPPTETCPQCGGAVHRLISGGAGAISKGGASESCAGGACDFSAGSGVPGGCCGGMCAHG